MENRNRKKIAPIVITILVILYIAPMVGMVAYAAGIAASEGIGGVVPFLLLYALIGGAVVVGIVHAMTQRLREIDGGEEDEARKY